MGLDRWLNILVCNKYGFMVYFTEVMSVRRMHKASITGRLCRSKDLQGAIRATDRYDRYTDYKYNKEFAKKKQAFLNMLAVIELGLSSAELRESGEFIITEENQSLENFQNSVKGKKLVLFGANENCMKFINNCLQSSEQAAYICDNDPLKHGKKLLGIEIVSPDVLQKENKENTVVVLCTKISNLAISWQARGFMKFAATTVMVKRFTDRAYYFAAHKEQFTQIKDWWCDNHSKDVWDKLNIKFQYGITDFSDIKSNQPEYLLDCLFTSALSDKEIVVSAGVYDGNDTKRFCDFFGKRLLKLYAFEPVTACFNLSKENLTVHCAKGYPIKLIKCGLLDAEEQVEMIFSEGSLPGSGIPTLKNAFPNENYIRHKKETVSVRPLDNIIPLEEKITYIKMDIEGAETKALLGAKRIIQEHKPRLAICLYHNPDDYFNIPLMLKEFVPEYKFYLRHSGKDMWDTILYATL
jgi:FkbM family methyltransferase